MRILNGIDPSCGNETLLSAVERLVEQLDTLKPPRSLCQLRPDTEDYLWLCAWAQNLTVSQIRQWTDGSWPRSFGRTQTALTQMQAVGLILLFLSAEVARREAQEGEVWSVVYAQFCPKAARPLFVQKQPTTWTKDALEAAAIRFHLRHAVGQEGVQAYYSTVYLQFGFTRKGMVRMPFWLTGYQQTATAGQLLDPITGSESFKSLWHCLQAYRHNNITEPRARRIIADSEWVLPEWADELLRRSRERSELVGATNLENDSDGRKSLPFLEEPRLKWTPGTEPVFLSKVTNLAALDLTEECYDLWIGRTHKGSFLRQPDERYHHPHTVELPTHAPATVAVLTNEGGAAHASLQMDLWPSSEEVVVFELPSGRRLDAWEDSMSPHRSYALLCSQDLEVRPKPAVWTLIAHGSRRLFMLPVGWDSQLEVLLEGEPLWTPHLGTGHRYRPAEPEWATPIMVRGQTAWQEDGWECSYSILGVTEPTKVDFIRLGARPLDFVSGPTGVSGQMQIPPENGMVKLSFLIGLRRDPQRVAVVRTFPLDFNAVTHYASGIWTWVQPEGTLSVAEASTGSFRFWVQPPWEGAQFKELALMEGTTYSTRPQRLPGKLGQFGGYGAPLILRSGPYNHMDPPLIDIAASIIDPGIVGTVESRKDGLWIHLLRPMEPDEETWIISWRPGKDPRIISSNFIIVEDRTTWRIGFWPKQLERMSIAIAYGGARIGAWWGPQHHERVEQVQLQPAEALQAAGMLRWMHLPLLAKHWLPCMRRFAFRYPVETLTSWLNDHALLEGLTHAPEGEEWIEVIRTVFHGWVPTPTEAESLCLAFQDADYEEPVQRVARRLMRVDPLLLGSFFHSWRQTKHDFRDQMNRVIRQLTGIDPEDDANALRKRLDETLIRAAKQLQVDEQFVREALIRPVIDSLSSKRMNEITKSNVATALGVSPFRECLGLHILWDLTR